MDVRDHLRHVPDIEKAIVDNKLDSLVMGLGPTSWLVPWMDRKIISKLRLWGAHDAFRIIAVDDLVLFDNPFQSKRLHPGSEGLKYTVESRPKRLWLYEGNAKAWTPFLHHCMESVSRKQPFFVWHAPRFTKDEVRPKRFELEWPRLHTGLVSPVGCTTLAWKEGCRRIGVIGVDMGIEHNTHRHCAVVDSYFVEMATQAREKGGLVANLSPITALKAFKAWTPPKLSTSGSEPTDFSKQPQPKTSSSIPSESTLADL